MKDALGVRVEAGFEKIMGLLNLRLNKNMTVAVLGGGQPGERNGDVIEQSAWQTPVWTSPAWLKLGKKEGSLWGLLRD